MQQVALPLCYEHARVNGKVAAACEPVCRANSKVVQLGRDIRMLVSLSELPGTDISFITQYNQAKSGGSRAGLRAAWISRDSVNDGYLPLEGADLA